MKKKRHPWLIQLLNWEYWPASIANIPVVLCWLYYGIRSRDLFFFSAVNPVIETGGVFGESKINILDRIPSPYLPVTVFIPKETPFETLLAKVEESALRYPVIAKPDVGERGFMVQRIDDETALRTYWQKMNAAFLIQEFIDLPLEISVLYHRFPQATTGDITSLCIKETLKVTGDGHSSVAKLMEQNDRAHLQLERFQSEAPALLRRIPDRGEVIELEPIGNHSRGTMFLNGNPYIDLALKQVFDEIHRQMDGMWYGRFDMKCQSLEALKKGQGFKILEFNGIASEPAHIYDPAYPLLQKYRDIFRHWRIIYDLGKVQRERGITSMTWSEALGSLRTYFRYLKSASA